MTTKTRLCAYNTGMWETRIKRWSWITSQMVWDTTNYLCAGGLGDYFDIPKNVDKIYVEFHDKEVPHSYKVRTVNTAEAAYRIRIENRWTTAVYHRFWHDVKELGTVYMRVMYKEK